MSTHEWEGGTIQLPSDQATAIRHAIVARHNAISERAFAAAKEVWDKATPAQRKDSDYLGDKLSDKLISKSYGWYSRPRDDYGAEAAALDRAQNLLELRRYGKDPRAPQKKNLPLVGKTETQFESDNATVVFDTKKNTLRWSADGNHGVENAHGEWLWEAVDAELDKVKWTRGSGGVIGGGNEYRPSEVASKGYGPTGLKDAPQVTQPFMKADGTRVTQREIDEARAKQLRGQAREKNAEARALKARAAALGSQDRRTNGQFDYRRGSYPEVRLR
jgi:hypothetical protein